MANAKKIVVSNKEDQIKTINKVNFDNITPIIKEDKTLDKNIKNTNIKSEGLIRGVIQVPADGNPIIMLSDLGTIGGYPKIANIISADLDLVGQLTPGTNINFKEVSLEEAENIFKAYTQDTNKYLNECN